MNGPVPSAALLRSPCFLTPASLTMKPQKPPRAATSAANGSLVTNFTAYFPAGSILSTALKSVVPLHALAELERPREAVGADLPRLGEFRHRRHVGVEAHELVVGEGRAAA